MSADPGTLNLPASCGKDELYSHTKEDEATIHPAIVLSEEQANILAKVKKGDSVFITGPAGSYSYQNRTIFMR
jgi:single-stranded DNA-binding protein